MSPPPGPPPNAQPLLAQPLVFELQLTKPSGAAVVDADVEIQWDDDQSSYHNLPKMQKTKTDAAGKHASPCSSPRAGLRPTRPLGLQARFAYRRRITARWFLWHRFRERAR